MLIRNGKAFGIGIFLSLVFAGLLVLIFSPVMEGGKMNGLQYADNSFNMLAKGSSYFIPAVSESVGKFSGKTLEPISFEMDKKMDVEAAKKILGAAGAQVEIDSTKMKLSGDLGEILKVAVRDADSMYKNDGKTVSALYGMDEKTVLKTWWLALNKLEKELTKNKLLEQSKIVSDVTKKAIEPGYNFYGIEAQKVKEHWQLLAALLIFYILYTLLWGCGIFYIFEGIGLSMTKAKVKLEI